MSTTTTLTALLTLPLSFPFYLFGLITSDQNPQDPISHSTASFPSESHLPDLNQHNDRACAEPGQLETIQAIEMAVAAAEFRRWGEEQGWSACRMRSERRELRERLLRNTWEGDEWGGSIFDANIDAHCQ